MSLRHFLLLHSVIYAFFALALFFAPTLLWPMYGIEISNGDSYFLSQHNSIFLGGLALVGFLFLDQVDNIPVAQRLLKALLGANILGMVITLYASVQGIFSGFGWSDPAFFALLAGLSLWQLQKSKQLNTEKV